MSIKPGKNEMLIIDTILLSKMNILTHNEEIIRILYTHIPLRYLLQLFSTNRALYDILSRRKIEIYTHHLVIIKKNGSLCTYVDCLLHSINDKPAISRIIDGKEHHEWYHFGERHRDNDKPAVIDCDGSFRWFKYGYLHRDDDKPAVISLITDLQEWYQNGRYHRENGLPARVYKDVQEYYVNGLFHRDNDLPAAIADSYQIWFIHGKRHREGDNPSHINTNGNKKWYKHDELHREFGPAVITASCQEWYYKGKLHREDDLPAIEKLDPISGEIIGQSWYKYGKLHRSGDLPAIINLKSLKYGLFGLYHRDNKPAIIDLTGNRPDIWYTHGREHASGYSEDDE